jgi:hypothetical protein
MPFTGGPAVTEGWSLAVGKYPFSELMAHFGNKYFNGADVICCYSSIYGVGTDIGIINIEIINIYRKS